MNLNKKITLLIFMIPCLLIGQTTGQTNTVNWSTLNLTTLGGFIALCLTVMGTLVKLYAPNKKIKEEALKKSDYLTEMKTKIEDNTNENKILKERFIELDKTVSNLDIKSNTYEKNIESIQRKNDALVERLDDLLKHIMEWVNN
jgi:septal ring factor EnvC (AmiA/AmiB activator)